MVPIERSPFKIHTCDLQRTRLRPASGE